MNRIRLLLFLSMLMTSHSVLFAQPSKVRVFEFKIPRPKPEPVQQRWRVGVIITANKGSASGIRATVPVPMDWPEQKVSVAKTDKSKNVGKVSFQTVNGGARQMVVSIGRLRTGESARAVVTLESKTEPVAGPENPEEFQFAKSSTKLRPLLVPSPLIESKHVKVVEVAEKIVDGTHTPWQQVRSIFDWVRKNVKYRQVENTSERYLAKDEAAMKGAVAVLEDRFGDCDEMTSLFVAICRAREIPARAVWVIGHSYPEFYLEDAAGRGHWIPCQIAGGNDDFGRMPDPKPIMQKGEGFRVPGERDLCRYLRPSLTVRRADAAPKFEVVLDRVAAEE